MRRSVSDVRVEGSKYSTNIISWNSKIVLLYIVLNLFGFSTYLYHLGFYEKRYLF